MSAILFNNQEQQQLITIADPLRNVYAEQTTPPQSTVGAYGTPRHVHCSASAATDDICEEVLGQKMSALDLHDVAVLRLSQQQHHHQQHNCGDGSDSGVEIVATSCVSVTTLQRALSSNSGGYASSSNGGLDETTHGLNNMSCDSSMLSCASDLYEIKMADRDGGSAVVSGGGNIVPTRNNYECCSENGSESSSVAAAAAVVATRRSTNNGSSSSVKKKVAMFEPPGVSSSSSHGGGASRSRLSGLKRTASLPRPHASGHALTLQKQHSSKSAGGAAATTAVTPTTSRAGGATQMRAAPPPPPSSATKPQKPDSLPTSLSRTQSISMQRLVQRTPSLSRARTPGTPSDDGRWPTVARSSAAASRRGLSVTPDLAAVRMRSSMLAELKPTSGSNPYSTLPRRRKQKSVEDLTGRASRSSSITRESSRMTSSVVMSSSSSGTRKNLVNSYGSTTPTSLGKMVVRSSRKEQQQLQSTPPPLPPKTRIYHETSVQTVLTSDDIAKTFAGGAIAAPRIEAAEQRDQQTQADIRDRELERLRDEVRQLAQREHELNAKLQREREEKLQMQRELHLNTERVMVCLEMARGGGGGTPTSEDGSGHDSLLMLESQIQMSGHELIERQQQIGHLRQLCRSLQLEMERSLQAQACLLQEKAAIEQESSELQDFLQHEKAAMCDALKEIESEYQTSQQQLLSRDEEVKVLRDECRHLVRLNEQRRQENRLLQTKYAALEVKSKDLMAQQNCSVSGASAALSGLHTRLDSLVEQLVSSYSISEQDLEDIGFQNDSSTQPNSLSYDGSNDCCETTNSAMPKTSKTSNGLDLSLQLHAQLPQLSSDGGSLSPQRNQSFIAAVISAIRNATTPAGKRLLARNGCSSGSGGKQRSSAASGGGGHNHNNHNQHNNSNNNNNNNHNDQTQTSNGDDSDDSTEMLDSETEPCLMMDNVLEDVTMPDSHSHNMVSSCTTAAVVVTGSGIVSQLELPSAELVNAAAAAVNGCCDESLHNLSQAITNRQQMELHVNSLSVQKVAASLQLNHQCDNNSISEDVSCHDSVAEMPSLAAEFCSAQAVVDQVIEVDSLVTKLLKVLRLIQMDNDNCIQQLIVDKNKLQQHKEDMLEKLKDLQDVNVKLQDELMDATQELMLKNSDLSGTKAEMQRHRNEIDRLTEDICNLSTLCSNYKKLSPSTEFPPFPPIYQHQLGARALLPDPAAHHDDDEAAGILNLLRMWQAEGQLQDNRVRRFLSSIGETQEPQHDNGERLRIYANQLENVLSILAACSDDVAQDYPALQQLRRDIEIVKRNADWAQLVSNKSGGNDNGEVRVSMSLRGEDENANDAEDAFMTS